MLLRFGLGPGRYGEFKFTPRVGICPRTLERQTIKSLLLYPYVTLTRGSNAHYSVRSNPNQPTIYYILLAATLVIRSGLAEP